MKQRYCKFNTAVDTTVRKFNNFNIIKVNAIQKKYVYPYEMGEQIKNSLLN